MLDRQGALPMVVSECTIPTYCVSSGSRCSSEDESDDDLPTDLRGRAFSEKSLQNGNGGPRGHASTSILRKASPHGTSSGDSTVSGRGIRGTRTSFTRSRSPSAIRSSNNLKTLPKFRRHMSPSVSRTARQNTASSESRNVLSANCHLQLRFPLGSSSLNFIIDTRKLGESLLLLLSLLSAAYIISSYPTPTIPYITNLEANQWRAFELQILSFVSFIYLVWTHTTYSSTIYANTRDPVSILAASSSARPAFFTPPDGKDSRRQPSMTGSNKSDFGYVWMSVPKNYRESRDDGIFTGLLLGPLIASALLIASLSRYSNGGQPNELPAGWLIEAPVTLKNSQSRLPAAHAVLVSRYGLVDLSTFCSTILLFHVCASWWMEKGCVKEGNKPEGERASVPRSEGQRSSYYILFTLATSIAIVGLKIALNIYEFNLWNYLNIFEVVVASIFYQFTLYVALRLAHRGFTLGELGITCFGGTALCLEFLNLTIARIWPVTTPFVRTYRLPTPLLIFQIALIVGSFLTGFLLSPFLVLSRSNAQRPVHRLRFPQEKERNRRYYALSFYIGTLLIVGGLIGLWTRWCLGNRDPWLWVIFHILEGKKKWSRPALLAYWALLGILSVAGWNRQLKRSRRFRPPRNPAPVIENQGSLETIPASPVIDGVTGIPAATAATGPLGMTFPTSFPNIPNLPNGKDMSNVATDLLDAADKHVPILGLNARRKFFHSLAVVMFVPGLAIDPAFTHLSFSAAFALFTFTEYIRYFAIYPFGASVHLFMNEFLDHRDSGTAILSHFYLLTGCAGSLWLEGPSQLLQFTGILTLGVGDAAASIIGRRLGVYRWSPTTFKTLEGSLAFVLSIFVSAMLVRLSGYVEAFSSMRYLIVVIISAVLEALSDQNDNLTLPLYMWSMLVVAGVEQGPPFNLHVYGLELFLLLFTCTNVCASVITYQFLKNLGPPMYQSDAPLSSHSPLEQHSPTPSPQSTTDRAHITGYMVQKRPAVRKLNRPSTAPSGEDLVLLPSLPNGKSHSIRPSASTPSFNTNVAYSAFDPEPKRVDGVYPMQTVLEDDTDFNATINFSRSFIHPNTSIHPIKLPLASFPSSMNVTSPPDYLSVTSTGERAATKGSDCDWATFITAYAAGRWDPRRTPNPPRTCQHILSESFRHSGSEPLKSIDLETSSEQTPASSGSQTNAPDRPLPGLKIRTDDQSMIPTLPPLLSGPSLSPTSIKSHPPIPLHLPLHTHRVRNSFSNSLPNTGNKPQFVTPLPSNNADIHATVATMRWAAARVDISPLALPSPEHELTDPMRGVTASIPGAHSQDPIVQTDYSVTPGGARKSRLTSFWEGTTDIDNGGTTHSNGPTQLSTIAGSPPDGSAPGSSESVMELLPTNGVPSSLPSESPSPHPPVSVPLHLLTSAPAASAPAPTAYHGGSLVTTDYFGDVRPPAKVEPKPEEPKSAPLQVIMRDENAMPENGTLSVPALPRRVCLTRQISSPLPAASPHDAPFVGGRVASESVAAVKLGRAAKEEQMFAELGYLAPPNPPDELERRRALYKFNIWNTGPDMNFDRIAHLAKLVFSTKGVIVSLIDGNEQWFKSEWGIKTPSCARAHSFCGHSILQRGDEPTVVLDTHNDWRFAKNITFKPMTIGPPHIRFYAGAPLRTQDGFNIGTLAVIDDQPRDEFSPRQRHTLKEFAAIAMREMELWRDKIQLRIRDRIQNSARAAYFPRNHIFTLPRQMEQFSRECLEIDTEVHNDMVRPDLIVGTSMDRVYDRAAKLVKRTLDVEGVIVMDVTHCEVLESMSAEGSISVTMHHGDPQMEMTKRQLTTEEYHKLNTFFEQYPDGRISEGIIPPSFRPFLPTHIQYALMVPIYNIDKRPFALLCAYNANDHAKRFLEGHELSYLRAIGVIILSAVLKRRMILADKAKGLFISNISHELRTPLHGILAAAELLSESPLNHSQASFLQTVQACGTSLVETVNHVLDFTKLSGNSKAGGVENVIVPTVVDLMQLVEEAVDGCWIGHRARTAIMGDSGIGSVYSPPKEDRGSPVATRRKHVETVVDIGHRPEPIKFDPQGWSLKCEKGGIRRVLMNLFGNSLKFTNDGYVHVVLRQLPPAKDDPQDKVKVELAVFDTGKGISQNFLKNQLFHPFSQENPLQTGTGLGLAIVSSIVTSENVGGKVDVWSEEGVGTEIKVTFTAEVLDTERKSQSAQEMESFRTEDSTQPLPTVSLIGLTSVHNGVQLLNDVLRTYLTTWWGFEIVDDGDIVIVNDDPALVISATERRDTSRPFIILSAARGSPTIMSIASEHERIGGFCRILYKPGGPSRLRVILKLCVHALRIGKSRGSSPMGLMNGDSTHGAVEKERSVSGSSLPRRNSEETHTRTRKHPVRPSMTPRSSTAHPVPSFWMPLPPAPEAVETPDPETPVPTITVGSGGTLLKSSVGSLDSERRFRVLVVEDNSILRNLLLKWLSNKGYDFQSAVDGRDGVNVYEQEGPFDVVLLDLSMPVLDGVGATKEIRRIEKDLKEQSSDAHRSRILALTGMSSLEDKRRAFDAGVDGYLVKPVAFKTLDDMFHKLGVS
ncbi:hypothetical protein B0H34DRAFT_801693 [Crassisporium funariophilum]|nr:hypothetical protein B0H34DRAFT_801693 [Crassisporium funariophilum]